MTPVFIFLFGLAVGSFLNVCIHRLPQGASVIRPRSHCPHCQTPIGAYDNIPVLSYLLLRGRCRHCQGRIALFYPLVELSAATLLLTLYFQHGLSLLAFKKTVLGLALLVLIVTDLRERILPDRVTYPALAAGFVFALWVPVEDGAAAAVARLTGLQLPPRVLSLGDALLGVLVGAGFLFAVRQGYLWWRGREGMGLGDVKMMGMVGGFLGVKQSVLAIFAASVGGSVLFFPLFGIWMLRALASIRFKRLHRGLSYRAKRPISPLRLALVKTKRTAVPFGVFLGAAATLFLFWGDRLVSWYMSLISLWVQAALGT